MSRLDTNDPSGFELLQEHIMNLRQMSAAVLGGTDSHDAAHAGIDAAWVVARLEEAGTALLALPRTGYSTRLRTGALPMLPDPDSPVTGTALVRPSPPSAAEISRMDEAFGWLSRIPADRFVMRRIVGARALVNPVNGRHLYPWRRLAALLGADHKAVQRWHAQGVAAIVASLCNPKNV